MAHGHGQGILFKKGRLWHCRVYVDGKPVERSAKTTDYEKAKRELAKMNGQKARGELGGRNGKLTIAKVLDTFVRVLPTRAGEDTVTIQTLVINAHLRPHFGAMRADKITTDALLAYREARRKEKTNKGTPTSPSTINRELAILRNSMRTAAHAAPPLLPLACIPRFPIVSEDEFARQGFTEYEAFERLTVALPPYLVPIATASYHTGIRLGELKKVEWPQVDFTSKLIRLRRGRTKGGQPRTCPFIASMEKVLLAAKKERDEFWPDCQYVFARLGKPLKDIRGAWNSACERAGVPALQFHDLRRSGVRNLTRAGVPEKISMEIIGHKTRSTFDRYNIVAEADLVDAAARVAAYLDAKKGPDSDLNRGKNRGSAAND